VFVVWFRMLDEDERSRSPRAVFTDRRVVQRWDEPKAAGAWFMEHLRDLKPARPVSGAFPQRADAMWDTWLLFDRGAIWTDVPGGLVSWGYTIMDTRGQFQEDVEAVAGTRR
jgi:hypothetical protein